MAKAMHGRYAAIDIGTVTCRLLVADVEGGRVVPVAKGYEIVNLGEGVDATGRLSAGAMGRVAGAIDRYREQIAAFDVADAPVLETIVMATSAARDAENADDFAALLAQRGLALSVIPGEKEAALSFSGAVAEFGAGSFMVVDVGGGSTEVVSGKRGEAPAFARSFDIGCRRMTERFFSSDPVSADEERAARMWCANELARYFAQNPAAREAKRMIAVAGTATSVVSMREEMKVYDSERVHGSTVTREELRGLARQVGAMTLAERERVAGLDPRRAPVIFAGLVILEEVMDAAGFDRFTVSESDILQGMILEAARREAGE